ncbi:MAG: queuosine precursor transporter [Prevotellamassilia sp.]|nr:queuosine precursor transporter [Prevotellamassilia sp.]
MLVTAVFATLYLVSNVMAVKVICILDYPTFDAGTITFPFAYMLGDVLTEIWGYRTAKKVIWITFLCNIILVACTQIGVWLPSPDYLQETANAYNHLFTYVPRIVVGSLVGFLLGELSNAWIMDWMKRKTEGKFLWLRTIGSSIVGYFFDTVPFVLIAFVGIVSTRDLLLMLATQYVMKLGIEAFFGTPMAYAVIAWVKRSIKRREQWNATH